MRRRRRYFGIALLWLLLVGMLPANDEIDALITKLETGDDTVIDQLLEHRDYVLKRIGVRKPDEIEVKKQLANLAHEKFAEREAASRKLFAMGPAVIPFVKKHLKRSGDPEVIERCRALLKKLPVLVKTKINVQRIKFLSRIHDLPTAVIQEHSEAYHHYMKVLPYDGKRKPTAGVVGFLDQYAKLPDTVNVLCERALKAPQSYSFEAFADAAFKADTATALRLLLTTDRHLSTTLEILATDYTGALTEAQWNDVADRLLMINGKEIYVGNHDVFRNLARHLAPHAMRFLNSEYLSWQALGLASYTGDWKVIQPQIAAMFKKAEKQYNRALEAVLEHIDPPLAYRPWLVKRILEARKLRLDKETILRHCRMTAPLPVDAILKQIGTPSEGFERSAWCDALLTVRPELKPEVIKQLLAAAEKTDDANQFDLIRNYLEYDLGKTFEVGKFDGRWNQFIHNKEKILGEGMRFIQRWKVSPALVIARMKVLKDNPKWRYYYGGDIAYLCNTASPDEDEEILNFVIDKIKKNERPFMSPIALLAVAKRRPDMIPMLLELSADSLFTSNWLTLRNAMLNDSGSNGNQLYDFVAHVRDPLLAKLKALDPREPGFKKWFPFVCILAVNPDVVKAHGDLLAKRLEQMIPKIDSHQHWAALVASIPLPLQETAVQTLLLKFATDPPEKYYQENILYALPPRYAAAVPALVRLSQDKGRIYPLRMALMISRENAAVLDELKQFLHESPDRNTVVQAARLLSWVNAMPPANALDGKRIHWIAPLGLFEDGKDKLVQLKTVMPTIRLEARADDCYFPPTHLFSDDADCQKLVLPLVLTMLKATHRHERQAAADMLWYCTDHLGPHMTFIHERLKKETDDQAKKALLLAVSKLGPKASFMADTVRTLKIEYEDARLTCLAKISRDVDERKRCVLELMRNRNNLWNVRQVRDLPEITKPFWEERLQTALVPTGSYSVYVTEYQADQIAWYLEQENSEKNYATLKAILEGARKQPSHVARELVSATLWVLRNNYKKRLPDCKTLIAKLPIKYKCHYSYWYVGALSRKATAND